MPENLLSRQKITVATSNPNLSPQVQEDSSNYQNNNSRIQESIKEEEARGVRLTSYLQEPSFVWN